jgi:hypothetical protein
MARGDAMGHWQRHHTSLSTVPRQAGESALHPFETDAVGCGDITQPSPPDPFLQGHGNAHPLSTQLVAEGAPVPVGEEAEGIGPPGMVAGVISVRLSCSGSRGSLAGPLAPNDQGLATKLEEAGVMWPTEPIREMWSPALTVSTYETRRSMELPWYNTREDRPIGPVRAKRPQTTKC